MLALLGNGDRRDGARSLAATTPIAELRDAFQLATRLHSWAEEVCAAVEREIAAGRPGEAAREWITSAFGVTRILLVMAIHDKDPRPSGTATTALLLIMMRNMIRAVCQVVPAWNADVCRITLSSRRLSWPTSWPTSNISVGSGTIYRTSEAAAAMTRVSPGHLPVEAAPAGYRRGRSPQPAPLYHVGQLNCAVAEHGWD